MAAPAWAEPAIHAAFGRDPSHNINKYEIGINWDSGFAWGNPQSWQARLQWEAELAQWDSRSGTRQQNVTEFGFSPILRVEKRAWSLVPFLEASIGVRLLSHTSTSEEHNFSTAFQFSDMVGIGVAFGPKLNAEAGFRFQHVSNAGIKAPNPGSNFYTGYMRYRF
ncbi:acyloxyacyl hydrolase [Cupriavidus sp. WKF15]|uniref:acyloxyacyl hydrolase n=1 Tax=Cupriavidus sp. WKF15 TaxID=3032282 RepID=UPI0023E258B2|nr:acyloxyacyl hydrolase [Cupriavidus sp. WKF15]WER47685.1 acyloxyacyl hydrolase [Cupriavidus sp. WKF15]